MEFEFATAQKIIFGPGAIGKLGVYAAEMGRCALVATNLPEAKTGTVFALLSAHHIAYRQFVVEGEPTIESVTGAIEAARHEGCDLFIGLGGGSALDTAKAAAALAANPGDLLGYLEVVGRGQPLLAPAFPVVAIPTTSGTGAEVTRNAVIGSPQHEVKVSLRSPWMLPRLALVDPNLTRGLPQDVTASTGMDALTQLIEPFLSSRANPIADAFCREGLPRAARSIRAAYERDDPAAREQMALASLLGGLALANAGLGVVHGFASVLGGMLKAPHGAVCAALLPHALRLNLQALTERQPHHPALSRFEELAGFFLGRGFSSLDGIAWVEALCREMKIPGLQAWGLQLQHLSGVVEKTLQASSTKANPLPLSADELFAILEKAL